MGHKRMRGVVVAALFIHFSNFKPHPEEPGPEGTRRLEGWPHYVMYGDNVIYDEKRHVWMKGHLWT